jgi:hypothetical protein
MRTAIYILPNPRKKTGEQIERKRERERNYEEQQSKQARYAQRESKRNKKE